MSIKAICVLEGKAPGIIYFEQIGNQCHITGNVSGLTPGKHGFNVHEYGDLSSGHPSTGGHFNPYRKSHGSPADDTRHIGDLGNIIADESGQASVDITDKHVSLTGVDSIIGRAIVVHEGEDDLGQGGNPESKITGNSGGGLSYGVIGIESLTQTKIRTKT